MPRSPFMAARVLLYALLLGAAASLTPSAHALIHLGIHRHPTVTDTRISMTVYNRGPSFRDVKIGGHVYTVLPHDSLGIKAPEGTPVYADSTGSLHRKGDLLFAVDRTMENKTVAID